MSIPMLCPCGHTLNADKGSAGLGIQCPKCGREVVIPSRPERGRKTRLGFLLGAAAAGLTLLLAVLVPAIEKIRDAADRTH